MPETQADFRKEYNGRLRILSPNLRRIFFLVVRIVSVEMHSSVAICLVLLPEATAAHISSSRKVSLFRQIAGRLATGTILSQDSFINLTTSSDLASASSGEMRRRKSATASNTPGLVNGETGV